MTLLKIKQTKEDIISTSNRDGCIGLHPRRELIVEYTRLHLIGNENEKHFMNLRYQKMISDSMLETRPSATSAAFAKSCSTMNPFALALSAYESTRLAIRICSFGIPESRKFCACADPWLPKLEDVRAAHRINR